MTFNSLVHFERLHTLNKKFESGSSLKSLKYNCSERRYILRKYLKFQNHTSLKFWEAIVRPWTNSWINREVATLISRKYNSLPIRVRHRDCQQSRALCMHSEWCVFGTVYYGSRNDNPDAHTARYKVERTRLDIVKHDFFFPRTNCDANSPFCASESRVRSRRGCVPSGFYFFLACVGIPGREADYW